MSTRDGLAFRLLCRLHGLPEPTTEHAFAKPRRWRFDYAWIDRRVALEVDGGIWTGGRHTSGHGFTADIEKLNEAAVLGWCVVRCIPKDLAAETTFTWIRRAIERPQGTR